MARLAKREILVFVIIAIVLAPLVFWGVLFLCCFCSASSLMSPIRRRQAEQRRVFARCGPARNLVLHQ
jgi:hypothetical protein